MQSEHEKRAESTFIQKQHYKGLSKASGHSALLFNDLIKLASGVKVKNAQVLMAKINQSLTTRRQYIELCKQYSFDTSFSQAAASTNNEWTNRETEKFTIKFKRDAQNENQVYVLLTIMFATQAHNTKGVTLNVNSNEHLQRIDFPALDEGKTQMLFDIEAPELLALNDKNAEIIVV